MIVVFGATGTTGVPLVAALRARGAPVRAVTRDAARAAALEAAGVAASVADFDTPAALERACAGADKVFLVTPAHERMREWKANVIAAARRAGVAHVVMSTGLGASPRSRIAFGQWHAHSQELLKESGLDWTLIQPTYFMQNLLWQARRIAGEGAYHDDIGGPVAFIDARDIADVSAEALTGEGHAGKSYGLTGPQALDGEAIAAALSRVTGRRIVCRPVEAQVARAEMIASGSAPVVADAMVELAALGPKGYLAAVEPTVEELLGRPPRRLENFVHENAAAFTR